MSDSSNHSELIYHSDFCGFNVTLKYSKEYFLSGDELTVSVALSSSDSQTSKSSLQCISVYLYGIATFSSQILNDESEANEFETSFNKECIIFPFLTAEQDNINQDDRLRLIFITDAALLEPSIICENSDFADKFYQLKILLPPFLPPSFNGQYTKVKYSACLSAQHYNNGNFERIYLRFPFKIIGSCSSKLPIMDRCHMPMRITISNLDNAETSGKSDDDLYNKLYDWWSLMNEDCGLDYEGIGADNFKNFIFNFLLEGVETVDLQNHMDLNSTELLDYKTLVEKRRAEAVEKDYLLLKIGSNGINLCSIKLRGSENSVVVDMDSNLIIKIDSLLEIDFEFYHSEYTLKMIQISLTANESYRLDADENKKVRDKKHKFPSVHCLQKIVTPFYKKISSQTILKRLVYCNSYDSTSITLHIPHIEPSFNWDNIALYYKLNFYFHISNNLALKNKVQVSPYSTFKTSSYTINTIITP